jgi:hypothetical protein
MFISSVNTAFNLGAQKSPREAGLLIASGEVQ